MCPYIHRFLQNRRSSLVLLVRKWNLQDEALRPATRHATLVVFIEIVFSKQGWNNLAQSLKPTDETTSYEVILATA